MTTGVAVLPGSPTPLANSVGCLFLVRCAWDSSGRCCEGRGWVGVPGVVVAEGVV
jgi:hypothetical protein